MRDALIAGLLVRGPVCRDVRKLQPLQVLHFSEKVFVVFFEVIPEPFGRVCYSDLNKPEKECPL